MSKFTDRLQRLHSSRVRALEESDDGDQRRVFTADEVEEVATGRAASPEPVCPATHSANQRTDPATLKPALEPEERPSSPAREAVRERLELGQRVGAGRRRPARLEMRRAGDERPGAEPAHVEPAPIQPGAGPRDTNPRAVGERLTDLRIQAKALIEAGRIESALPMLHEMLALSPANPFPLQELARYWRSVGDDTIADLYRSRLASVAPY